jgi:hypothetical protein
MKKYRNLKLDERNYNLFKKRVRKLENLYPSEKIDELIKNYVFETNYENLTKYCYEYCTTPKTRNKYKHMPEIEHILLKNDGKFGGYISTASCKTPQNGMPITAQLSVVIDKIFIDLDNKENPSLCHEDVDKIKDTYGAEVIFSGNKGYHCIIYCEPFEVNPNIGKQMLKHIIGKIEDELELENLDEAVKNDNIRLRRLPGTVHHKSKEKCHIMVAADDSKMMEFKESVFKETYELFKDYKPFTAPRETINEDKDRPKIVDLMEVANPKHFCNTIRGEKNASCYLINEYVFFDMSDYCCYYTARNDDGKWFIKKQEK